MNVFFIIFAAVSGALVLFRMLKDKHGVRAFLLSAVQGIASIFAVNIAGLLTGVSLSVNWYTLGAAALLGMPGTVGLLAMKFIFGA